MSVSLCYRTCSPIDVSSKANIANAAALLNSDRVWWCEGINFFDHPGYPDLLTGSTKLFLIGYSTSDGGYMEVDPDEDCFMVAREVAFIVETLADWSRKYDVDWVLECEGETLGEIKDGVATPSVEEVAKNAGLGAEVSRTPEAEEQARHISEKYASRW